MADKIDRVEAFCLHLPYVSEIRYASTSDVNGTFVVLRITTRDGAVGLAECSARAEQSGGDDIHTVAYQIDTHLAPLLIGMDPLAHDEILHKMKRFKRCAYAKALVDNALWDIKGKLLKQPVWRLLGGSTPKPVPISSIVFGYASAKDMARDAAKAVEDQGMRGFKIKTWKRSMEDVEVIREIRNAVGPDIFLYIDANRTYTPGEARRVFPHMADYDVRLVEDPCKFVCMEDAAKLASVLPVPVLADAWFETPQDVYNLARCGAIGAVSVKINKTGMTQAMQLINFCEMAGLQVVIGTNMESRVGTLPMIHVWSAFRALQNIPSETGFYRHVADDVYEGDLVYRNGTIEVPEAHGFGGSLDEKKIAKYRA